MATKKEIDEYCKESGYTRTQLSKAYDEAKEVNPIIKKFDEMGITWNKMAIHQIEELIGLKERTLQKQKELEEAKAKESAERTKKEEEKKYYEDHIEEILLNKLLNKEALKENELIYLIDNYEIETEYSKENNRWTRNVRTIISIGDKYYAIEWQEGLTEYQENVYDCQPYEVTKGEKTIVITVWNKA